MRRTILSLALLVLVLGLAGPAGGLPTVRDDGSVVTPPLLSTSATWTKSTSGSAIVWDAVAFAGSTCRLVQFGGRTATRRLHARPTSSTRRPGRGPAIEKPRRGAWPSFRTPRPHGLGPDPAARDHVRRPRRLAGIDLDDTWAFDPAAKTWAALRAARQVPRDHRRRRARRLRHALRRPERARLLPLALHDRRALPGEGLRREGDRAAGAPDTGPSTAETSAARRDELQTAGSRTAKLRGVEPPISASSRRRAAPRARSSRACALRRVGPAPGPRPRSPRGRLPATTSAAAGQAPTTRPVQLAAPRHVDDAGSARSRPVATDATAPPGGTAPRGGSADRHRAPPPRALAGPAPARPLGLHGRTTLVVGGPAATDRELSLASGSTGRIRRGGERAWLPRSPSVGDAVRAATMLLGRRPSSPASGRSSHVRRARRSSCRSPDRPPARGRLDGVVVQRGTASSGRSCSSTRRARGELGTRAGAPARGLLARSSRDAAPEVTPATRRGPTFVPLPDAVTEIPVATRRRLAGPPPRRALESGTLAGRPYVSRTRARECDARRRPAEPSGAPPRRSGTASFVLVGSGGPSGATQRQMQRLGIDVPVVMDWDGSVNDFFRWVVVGTIVVDADGVCRDPLFHAGGDRRRPRAIRQRPRPRRATAESQIGAWHIRPRPPSAPRRCRPRRRAARRRSRRGRDPHRLCRLDDRPRADPPRRQPDRPAAPRLRQRRLGRHDPGRRDRRDGPRRRARRPALDGRGSRGQRHGPRDAADPCRATGRRGPHDHGGDRLRHDHDDRRRARPGTVAGPAGPGAELPSCE